MGTRWLPIEDEFIGDQFVGGGGDMGSSGSGFRLEVVAILRSGRVAAARSLVTELLASGKAEDVFPPQRKTANTESREELPRAVVVDVSTINAAQEVLERLGEDPFVEESYIAPPRMSCANRTTAHRDPPDASQIDQWGLDAIRWGQSNRPDAANVVVGVVDSGIDNEHPELREAIKGYVNQTNDDDLDHSGHGSHVCGIVAARGKAGAGIVGVSNARVYIAKGLGKIYSAKAYYRALQEAISQSRVVNLSLSGPEDPYESIIVKKGIRDGVSVVAAAGNECELGNPDCYPAMISDVICVGAVDRKLLKAPFSNTGAHLRLCAPGVEIWSTSPRKRLPSSVLKTEVHAVCDGTSMASPFVAAAVGLMLAKNPNLTPSDINQLLRTRPCQGQSGRSDEFGEGILDLEATLAAVPVS